MNYDGIGRFFSSLLVRPLVVRPLVVRPLVAFEELVRCQADVFRDLAEQGRRDVPSGMEGNGGPATVRMAELLVGALLSNLCEAQAS